MNYACLGNKCFRSEQHFCGPLLNATPLAAMAVHVIDSSLLECPMKRTSYRHESILVFVDAVVFELVAMNFPRSADEFGFAQFESGGKG